MGGDVNMRWPLMRGMASFKVTFGVRIGTWGRLTVDKDGQGSRGSRTGFQLWRLNARCEADCYQESRY